jgi:hypothetical protein
MTLKPLLLWSALNLLGSQVALADDPKCVKVFDADTVSIRLSGVGATGNSQFDTTLHMGTREIKGTLSRDPAKKVSSRTLDADELAAVVEAFKPLCLASEAKKQDEPFGGGSSRFELRQKDGSARVVAYKGAVADGSTYFPVDNEVGQTLYEAYPLLDQKRVPLTTEQSLKKFILEIQFGPPGGPRAPAKSYRRLDPKGTLFTFNENKYGPDDKGVQVQVTPKAAKVDARALAHELDIEHPIAYLANGEHGVWYLGNGDTQKPVGKWRLGDVEVRLTMPSTVKIQSRSGQVAPLDGATVDYVIARMEK